MHVSTVIVKNDNDTNKYISRYLIGNSVVNWLVATELYRVLFKTRTFELCAIKSLIFILIDVLLIIALHIYLLMMVCKYFT